MRNFPNFKEWLIAFFWLLSLILVAEISIRVTKSEMEAYYSTLKQAEEVCIQASTRCQKSKKLYNEIKQTIEEKN